jgi:hypothetical protein
VPGNAQNDSPKSRRDARGGFSVARLMDFLKALNYDIEIVIRNRPRSTKPGKIKVSAA